MVEASSIVEDLLREGATTLRRADIENPRLDARVLLAAVMACPSSSLLPGDTTPVSDDYVAMFRAYLTRRCAHEPVSRILGHREFMGLTFQLGPATLDPRPDSEVVVELALRYSKTDARVLDLGTGTGCLVLSLLAQLSGATGVGVDISPDAVRIANLNAESLGLQPRVSFACGSWFDPVRGQFDLIISNPPYIPASDLAGLMPEVRDHDPQRALDGGGSGLDAYRAICTDARPYLSPHGVLVFEIGAGQQHDVVDIASAQGLVLTESEYDLGGHIRALAFTSRS